MSVGDMVQICSDVAKARVLNKRVGWKDEMDVVSVHTLGCLALLGYVCGYLVTSHHCNYVVYVCVVCVCGWVCVSVVISVSVEPSSTRSADQSSSTLFSRCCLKCSSGKQYSLLTPYFFKMMTVFFGDECDHRSEAYK